MRYDVICNFIHVWRHKIIKNEKMTSYLLPCSFYQKVSRYNVFQYKISDRMSYLTALYDNFEIFRKKNFNGEEFSKIETDFQSENGFELKNYRGIFFNNHWNYTSLNFSHYVTPNPSIIQLLSCKFFLIYKFYIIIK